MRIYVKTLYGKLFTLDLEGSNTVENVKAQFYDSQGISPNHQRLVYNGRELEEGCRTLAHYNVQNGSTILHFGTDVRCSDSVIHRNIAKGTTGNLTLNQMYGQWQTSSQVENDTLQDKQEELQHLQPKKQQLSDVELVRQGSGAESQSEQIGSQVEHDQLQLQQKQPDEDEQNQQPEQKSLQFSDKDQVQISEKNPVQRLEQDRFQHSESQNQYSYLQQLNNQQALAADQANNQIRENKRSDAIPFSMLIPALLPRLDKDRAMQLQTNFAKLRGNEVNKEGFLRFIKTIVGDQMLRREAHRIQIQLKRSRAARNSQTNSQQYQLKSQASSQQHTMPSCNVQQFTDAEAFSQVHSVLSAQQKKGHRSQHQPHILLENKDSAKKL